MDSATAAPPGGALLVLLPGTARKKLTEINSSLSAATAERFQKESLYNQIKESGSTIPAVLTNGLIQTLMNQHANLEAEYANLSKTFTPDFPKMKNLKSP